MPKAHKDRPATYETVTPIEGVESSPGSSFETSPEPTESTGEKSSSDDSDQKRARTAGRRRKKSEG